MTARLSSKKTRPKAFYGQLHQHTEVQISYIVKGQGKLIVSNSVHSYDTGEIYVIGSNTPHLFQSASSSDISHMITLFVTPESFGDEFFKIPELEEVKRFFRNFLSRAAHINKKKISPEIMRKLPIRNKLGTFQQFLKLIEKVNSAEVQELASFAPSKKNNFKLRRQKVASCL